MAAINALISTLTVIGMFCIAWGYRQALDERGTAARHFAASMVYLAVSTGLRRLYWDIFWFTTQADTGGFLADPRLGASLNTGFNLLLLAAIYHGLKARWLLLDDDERTRWPWWFAWAHPSGIYFLRRR